MLPSYNFDRDGFQLTGSESPRKIRSSAQPRVASHMKQDNIKKEVKSDRDKKVKKEEKDFQDDVKIKDESKDDVKVEIKDEFKDEIKEGIKEIKREVKKEGSDDEGSEESEGESEGEETRFGLHGNPGSRHAKGSYSDAAGGRERQAPTQGGSTYNSNFFGDGVYPKKSETIQRTFYAPPGWH